MSGKVIVFDANFLIRVVMGKRVRELMLNNLASGKFEVHPMSIPVCTMEVMK
jgi:hypothetical protein